MSLKKIGDMISGKPPDADKVQKRIYELVSQLALSDYMKDNSLAYHQYYRAYLERMRANYRKCEDKAAFVRRIMNYKKLK